MTKFIRTGNHVLHCQLPPCVKIYQYKIFFYFCMYMCMLCVCVLGTYAHGVQRVMLDVFHCSSQLRLLRQGFSMNSELTDGLV